MSVILGIESSCDETAVAIIDEDKILSHILFSQICIHKEFGGVVPEIAAREHIAVIDMLIDKGLKKAQISLEKIDAFCATTGPGLAGGLIVGSLVSKVMAFAFEKPFIAVNHLQGHALISLMNNNITFPFLLLLVSGGHTQFVAVLGVNKYDIIGQSIDDAIGEAFDKSARLMGLSYPGGVEIEKLALLGDKHKFKLPKPLYYNNNCNFSFSGLKTAVKDIIIKNSINEQLKQDLSASLQYTIIEILIKKCDIAISQFELKYGKIQNMVISGGVSANKSIQTSLSCFLEQKGIKLYFPQHDLCTDNAIMIAWAGLLNFREGRTSGLDSPVKVRWSLKEL